ncbi:Transcriptional repressor Tup1 [Gracilaria domingensis]|nr:Transcriptional repressor Tup1 [Gracilaria domingensis]
MNSAQQHTQQLIPPSSQPRVVPHALSAAPVHPVSTADRQPVRYAELLDQLRAEYDAVVSENKGFRSVREEYQRKVEHQLAELNNMERALEELERKHQIIKDQYDSEIVRLKAHAASHPTASVPSAIPSSAAPPPPPQQQPAPPHAPHVSEPAPQSASQIPSHQIPHSAPPHHSPVANMQKPADVPAMAGRPAQPKLAAPIPPTRTQIVADASAAMPSYSPSLHNSFPASRSIDQPHMVGLQHAQQHQKHPLHPSQSPHSAHPMQPASHPMQHQQQQQPPHQQPSLSQAHHLKFPRLQGPDGHPPGQPHNSLPLPSPGALGSGPSSIPPIMPNAPQNAPPRPLAPPQPAKVHNINMMTNGPTQEEMMQQHVGFKKEYPITAASHVSARGPAGPMMGSTMNPQTPLGQHPYRHRPIMAVTQLGPQPHHLSMHSQHPLHMENDWNVTQARSPNGSKVNMKLNLQHTLPHISVVCCVRYSWDGAYLATGSNRSADIFDAQTGQKMATFAKDTGPNLGDNHPPLTAISCCKSLGRAKPNDASANSQFIISGSGDKRAKLWSLETGALISTLGGDYGPTDGITSVSISPTSQHVAAGSLDKIVRVWDVESSRLVRQFEGHKDSVYSVAFSPDGRLILSGSLDKTLKLWDVAAAPQMSSQCRYSFSGHKDFVLSVTFSPDGRWLISGSKDRTVQFWDPRQPNMSVTLQGHKNSVISIAHNPVRLTMATGSGDCRARTWSYQTF